MIHADFVAKKLCRRCCKKKVSAVVFNQTIEVVVLRSDVPCGGLPIVPYSDIQIVRCAKIVRSFASAH